jgi:hypothetical protein
MTDWKLARRDLLKHLGVGAAVLPLLHATRSRAAAPAKKLMIIAASEGYRQKDWKPAVGPLAGQKLPLSCSKLEEHKGDLLFLPDMRLPSEGGCDTCGHGAYGVVYYGLGDARSPGEYKEPNGPTVDQVIAAGLPPSKRGFPTLALHIQLELAPTNKAPGYNHCFWKAAGQPVNPEGDPYKIYGLLFGKPVEGPPGDDLMIKSLFQQRKSILDSVGTALGRFSKRLGTDDRALVEGHLGAIRELEKQLAPPPGGAVDACAGPATGMIDLKNRREYPNIMNAHLDLMLAALRCGITQVATLQLGDGTGDNIDFGFIPGMSAGTGYKAPFRNWHDLAHHPMGGGKDEKQLTDQWYMDRFADLLTKMKKISDPEGGSLLDNSAVLWGNTMGDGQAHSSQHIPFILAGSCGKYADRRPGGAGRGHGRSARQARGSHGRPRGLRFSRNRCHTRRPST